MKYFTEHTVPKCKGQVFDKMQMTYKLDEVTGKVVEDEPVDMQALIQSNADCALNIQLEKFGVVPHYTDVDDILAHTDDPVSIVNSDIQDKFDRIDYVDSIASKYNVQANQLGELLARAEAILQQQQQQHKEVNENVVQDESKSDETQPS